MHGSTAARVRESKELHPEHFCTDTRCLWRVVTRDGIKPCPKHMATPARCACVNNGDLCDVCFLIDEAQKHNINSTCLEAL